jgi:serine protease Do
VTNAHVVEGATKIIVTLWNGNDYEAEILRVHPRVDLALLRIRPPRGLHKARIGNSTSLEVGEWVLAVGNPFGLGKTVTAGIVSGKGRYIGLGPDDDFIQTDASINPGNSGGPLFDMNGQVVGVNTAIIAAGKGIGFSIPANYINELLKSPDRMKAPSRGWLGIYVEEMTEKQATLLGLAAPRGTFVGEVLKSSPAFNAGLKNGDLILQANTEKIRNGRHLSRILAGLEPGKVLQVTVLRGNRTQTVDVVVGKSPE